MLAIKVKYLSPTDTKGSRYKATMDSDSLTAPYDYGLSDYDAAAIVAFRLFKKRNPDIYKNYNLIGGSIGNDYVFVLQLKE